MKGLLLLSFLCRFCVQAGPDYTTLVTFGDSNSDTGNAYRLSGGTWPPVPPFNANGGFADGLLWNQLLAEQFFTNATLEDFSCANATTDNRLVQGSIGPNRTQAPGAHQQIVAYISSKINETIDFDRTLYTIWVGANNYLFDTSLTPSDTIQSLLDCLNLLIVFGARHVVVFNEPPYDRFPRFRNTAVTNITRALYLKHNEVLTEKMNEIYLASNTRLDIRLFDSCTVISRMLNRFLSYGFENLDPCWDTTSQSSVIIQCENIARRVFSDNEHLTSAAQALLAKEFYGNLMGLNSTSIAMGATSMNSDLILLFISIVALSID